MKIPIEADNIRISDGELVFEEICAAADFAGAAYGQPLPVLTKSLYQLGSHHRLMDEDDLALTAWCAVSTL